MSEVYLKDIIIPASDCDAGGCLSYHDCFGMFMDVAAEHAEALGIGLRAMARRDLFWLTVKTQVRFYRRPAMLERCILRTWPELPGKMRGNRSYQLMSEDDEILVGGKTEWAVINTKTQELVPMQLVYPDTFSF